jgi:ABC-type transporter Mla subunit MlaD
VTTILDSVNLLVENVSNRASDQELGQTIQSVNRLVSDTNVTVLRLRTDLQRVMRELETSVENINEFTQILVENPSVLISGRTEKERQLPR